MRRAGMSASAELLVLIKTETALLSFSIGPISTFDAETGIFFDVQLPESLHLVMGSRFIYGLPLIGGGIKRWCLLSEVCLSRTSDLSREQRGLARKTKIGTMVAHVTRDSDTTFKVKRSRSPGRFTHRRVNVSDSCSGERAWERIGRGKLLLRCGLLGGAMRFGAHRGRRGAWAYPGCQAARLQLFFCD